MAEYTNSPNMSLPIPTVGIADGPEWATLLDNCLTILDGHSHVPGSGVPITPSAMNINTDLTMLGNNLISARSLRLAPQLAPLSQAGDLGCIYESGVDLYYNDGNGAQIRITQSGSLAGAAGTITGLPSGTASASYVSISGTFVFESATSIAANIDAGSLVMRNTSPNSTFSLTLSPPSVLGSNYALTLPAPVIATNFVTLDSSGIIAGTIPTAAGITGGNIASNINLPGNTVQENGKNVIVSSTNATNSLAIIRGSVNGGAALIAGEGFSASNIGAGSYTVTFTIPFTDTPVVTTTGSNLSTGTVVTINSVSTTGFSLVSRRLVSPFDPTNDSWSFIAIGQR